MRGRFGLAGADPHPDPLPQGERGGASARSFTPHTASRCSSPAARGAGTRALRRTPIHPAPSVHVAFRLPAEAASTVFAPSAIPRADGVDAVVLGERLGERVGLPGDNVDGAGGNVGTHRARCRNRSRRAECAALARRRRRCPSRSPARSARRRRAAEISSGQTIPSRPTARSSPTWTKRFLRRMHGAVVLVGEAGVEEQPADRGVDLVRAPRARSQPSSRADAPAIRGGAPRDSRDVIEHLRAVVRVAAPQPVALLAPRPRCGCPCGCPAPPGPASVPWDRAAVGIAGIGARLLSPTYILAVRSMPDAAGVGPARRSIHRSRGLRRRAARERSAFRYSAMPSRPPSAAEAALAIAAEPGRGVEQVGSN